ncbi:MAG TPA: hypothetical protein V6C72_04340 [Chroococcales cyanobacterium]
MSSIVLLLAAAAVNATPASAIPTTDLKPSLADMMKTQWIIAPIVNSTGSDEHLLKDKQDTRSAGIR